MGSKPMHRELPTWRVYKKSSRSDKSICSNAALKSSYDAQWSSNYGQRSSVAAQPGESVREAQANASAATQTKAPSVTASAKSRASDALDWDMATLDALLPDGDPMRRFPWQTIYATARCGIRWPPKTDLRKLISLLGGEVMASSEPATSQPISLPQFSAEHVSVPDPVAVKHRAGNRSQPVATARRQYGCGWDLPNACARNVNKPCCSVAPSCWLPSVDWCSGASTCTVLRSRRPPWPRILLPRRPIHHKPKPEDSVKLNNPPNLPPADHATTVIQPGANVKPQEIQATPMSPAESTAMAEKPAEPMKPEAMKPEPMKLSR